MISACLISSTMNWENHMNEAIEEDEMTLDMYDTMDGPSEEEVYLAGEFLRTSFLCCGNYSPFVVISSLRRI